MEISWWYVQLLKPILAVIAVLSLPKCILPLKKGIKEENQKLINKGMFFLMGGIFSILLIIYCMRIA